MTPTTTRINAALRRAGLPYRLLRGRGYYYVTHTARAAQSGLYVFRRLEATARAYAIAREHVNGVLAQEGESFRIPD